MPGLVNISQLKLRIYFFNSATSYITFWYDLQHSMRLPILTSMFRNMGPAEHRKGSHDKRWKKMDKKFWSVTLCVLEFNKKKLPCNLSNSSEQSIRVHNFLPLWTSFLSDDIKGEERNRSLSVEEQGQVSLSKLRSIIQRLCKNKQAQASYWK